MDSRSTFIRIIFLTLLIAGALGYQESKVIDPAGYAPRRYGPVMKAQPCGAAIVLPLN